MTLTRRKSRPLNRDKSTLRDDRLFLIGCDDTYAPQQYFSFFRLSRVQVLVLPTTDGANSVRHILDRLLDYELDADDERWIVIDTDHYLQGTHRRGFIQAIQEAKRKGVKIAISKPCFELWLLLHYLPTAAVKQLENAEDTVTLLRKTLGNYSKRKLNKWDFPLDSIVRACKRTRELDEEFNWGDIPEDNQSRVYLIWEAFLSKSIPNQVPDELKALLMD